MPNRRISSHLDEIAWIAKLADLKEDHYRNSLLLGALLELLLEKGLLTPQELAAKIHTLEASDQPILPTGNS
ncbi:hypothetical protein NLX71_18225 [Paenibacillus sp. MZ04-78.2]|uniref:hypothetical protein n=1 Tax=Paenibacillus sp. MZ04-78.2 TaxID=2962034 RepID=UPI0020B6D499|nr:hypothetical protein [Paenibacillus sp. MZ04-78.2]MCP3775211.1 hypothetical protein [Paenibacillus sp. MZ04-78.2]